MKEIPLRVGQYAILAGPEGKILALQRARSKKWSLPGGRLEPDERNWLLALKREILEETGIEISSANPYRVNIVEDLPYQVKYCVYFIVVTKVTDVKITEEHSDFAWIGAGDDNYNFEYPFVKKMVMEYLNRGQR